MPALGADDAATLERLEERLWRSATRFDLGFMERVLARDFVEIGRSSRVYDRAATLAVPEQPFETEIPLPDFQARALTADVAQCTYTSIVRYEGEPVQRGRRSSIWSRVRDRDGAGVEGWLLRFHQGTPLADS